MESEEFRHARRCDHACFASCFSCRSVGPFGLVVASVEQTAAGAHAFAQLWALLGRQLDTDLRPETEALHLVRLGEKHHQHRSIVDSQSARLDGRA